MKIGRLRSKEEFFKVVPLLQQAIREIYSFAEPADLYKLGSWIKSQLSNPDFDLFAVFDDDGEMAGFGYGYITNYPFLNDPVYFVEMVYMRPEYRRTNGLFLLLNALSKQSEKSGLVTISHLFADNRRKDGMPTIAKRFATDKKPFLVSYYRKP